MGRKWPKNKIQEIQFCLSQLRIYSYWEESINKNDTVILINTSVNTPDAVVPDKHGTRTIGFGQLAAAREAI